MMKLEAFKREMALGASWGNDKETGKKKIIKYYHSRKR